MNLSVRTQDSLGGLHHLMEAATALSDLVNSRTSQLAGNSCNSVTSSIPSTSRNSKRVVSDDEEEAVILNSTEFSLSPQPSAALTSSFVAVNSKEIFPQRLMHILSQPSISHIITWLPQGRSFVIIDPDVFASKILPQFFSETTSTSNVSPSNSSVSKSKNKKSTACKYPSFTRKLNRWGFRQISRGPDAGAFHHPLFQRENPNLCLEMVCQKSRRPSSSKSKASTESAACDSPETSKLRPLQSTPGLTIKREVSLNTVTDTDSYAPEAKALPPKKRKLRHSQVSEFGHNTHITSPQESSSTPQDNSHRNPEHIIIKSPQHMTPSSLKPKENAVQTENILSLDTFKKHELPSFHKTYLDSGAAQERSKEISEFLEKNLLELQKASKEFGGNEVNPSQSAMQEILLQKLQGNLTSQVSSMLSNGKNHSISTSQFSEPLHSPQTSSKPLGLIGSIQNHTNSATSGTTSTTLPTNMKDAKDNLYRAYLQALSS
jgi:hypothetical protein